LGNLIEDNEMTNGGGAVSMRKDPDRNFSFMCEIDGVVQAGFMEIIMPESYTEVIEYREGSEPQFSRKLPGLTKYTNLILKCGVTHSMELYNWRRLVEQGKIKDARRNIAVILMDEEGNPCARWEFAEAWPTKYSAPNLTAEGSDVAIETLEITFEKMERVK
jgi:phage tail-like protein